MAATGSTGYGVVPAGFYAKPLTVIDDELDEGLRGILGESAGTDSEGKIPYQTMAGQLKALLVDGYSAQWDLLSAAYASVDPNQNADASQDAIGAITGALREAARFSVATGICIGTPLTVLPAGRVAVATGTGSRFASLADKTIVQLTQWAPSTGYALYDLRYNATGAQSFMCVASGTASTVAPSGTSLSITDGTAKWRYLGEGIGGVVQAFQAQDVGAIGAATGVMGTIATPIAGWNNVVNMLAAETGNARETNAAFRIRRNEELAAPGNTTVDAIRANILKVNEGSTDPAHEPPTSCKVLYNDTDVTDANGLPPHSIEVFAFGGTTQDIAQAVWDSVGGGTVTYGNRSDVVTDSEGNDQIVYWSRPTEVPIYVTATGRYDAAEWPAGSDALVVQAMLSALLTYTSGFGLGTDVRTSPLIGAMMRGPSETDSLGAAVYPATAGSEPVPGLLEIDPIYIGISASPVTSTQISIGVREVATFNIANMVFTASTETP